METIEELSQTGKVRQDQPESARNKCIYYKNCNGPLQLPFIRETLSKSHGIKLSASLIRGYLREHLGLRYRVLKVVGQR